MDRNAVSALIGHASTHASVHGSSQDSRRPAKAADAESHSRSAKASPAGRVATAQDPRTSGSPVESSRKKPPLWAVVAGLVTCVALAAYWAGRQSPPGVAALETIAPTAGSAPPAAQIASPLPTPTSEPPQPASKGDAPLTTATAVAASDSAPSIAEMVAPAPAGASASEATAPQASPSFDCGKASSVAEKLVCAHEDLAKADSQLNLSYRAAMARNADATRVRREQLEWLRQSRDSCADADCVRRAYAEREAALANEPQ